MSINTDKLELRKYFGLLWQRSKRAENPIYQNIYFIPVFLILDMRVRNKKSGISSLYPA